jgi:hypothetical protein
MKRGLILVVGLFFALCCFSEANGWFGSKKKQTEVEPQTETVKPASAATAPQKEIKEKEKSDKALEEALKAKRALSDKKRNELNNTEWQIELTPLSTKTKKEVDIITFQNNQISFANFTKKGFPTTNYTLTVQDDGVVVWETMQTSEKSGIAFWRGEMEKNMQSIKGVLSHQIDQKNKQDYSFISTSKKNVPVSGNK